MKVRAELGRHPLSIAIKRQIASYFLRLKYNITNPILKAAFHYSISHPTQFQYITKNMEELDKKEKEIGEQCNKQEINKISQELEKYVNNRLDIAFVEPLSTGMPKQT